MMFNKFGEHNTRRRGLKEKATVAAKYSWNNIEHRLNVWPEYLTLAATNRSPRFLSECGIFAGLLIGLINAMAVAGADHFSHSAQLQK